MFLFRRGRIVNKRFPRVLGRGILSSLAMAVVCVSAPAYAGLTITPTFTSNFVNDFGANALAAENAWKAAAHVFETNFTDNIHVNITVDAVSGTSVFGHSNMSLFGYSFSTVQSRLANDAKSADDAAAVGAGGSASGPAPAGGLWWVSRAEAKALGLKVDDLLNDGKTTFGAGYHFTFSGPIVSGTYDFQGIAAHEISEVLGRLGISGGTIGSFPNSHSVIDLFSYTGAGARGLGNSAGNNFSIDNGTTLLKTFNDGASNHLDSRDWAPGTNDAFNQFSFSGVVNSVSATDLRVMDVIGYDLKDSGMATPEPATLSMWGLGAALVVLGRRQLRRKPS